MNSKLVRLALGGLLLTGVAVGAKLAYAQMQMPQGPSAAYKLPDKSYVTKSTFYLPVIVDDRQRAAIKEIHLYVKNGPAAAWKRMVVAPPTQTGFECRLDGDGEYWFNLVTIDQAGIATPPDVNRDPPAVIVVLDTAAPHVDLKPLPLSPEGICMKCDVRDANPNPMQTKFEYQDGNKMWRLLDSMPNQADCFCIPRQAVFSGLVRVTCTDRANNTTTREFNVQQMTAAAPVHQEPIQKVVNLEPAKDVVAPPLIQPALVNNVGEQVKKGPPIQERPKELTIQTPEPQLVPDNLPQPIQPITSVSQKNTATGAKWLMVNQPRISLDYSIADEGKSGIGKVDVWITKDNGRSWDVLCDDPDKKSPAVFDLPGEGVFGIRLSVFNGRGFGGYAPKSGDAPDYVVELDTTKPVAELRSVKLGAPDDGACIDITWQATDKNLGSTPIDLYYRSSTDGNWTLIAKGIANTGKHRWFLPQEIGRQAYVRMIVTDMAGNKVGCDFAEAVALDDLSRPRATITGIAVIPSGPGN